MQKILDVLLKATYYSSLNQISQKLAVSKISIYYDICKLNEWLEYYNVSGLKVVRGKGIFIDENNKKKNNQKNFKVYRELNLKYRHSKPKQEKNISKLIENPNLKFAKDARTSINYR